MLAESITVNTLDLRPLVQTVVESEEIANNVKDVTFEWQEYRAVSAYNRPTPHRVPLSGEIAPPADFVASCRRFLDRSGFQWTPEWLAKLSAGSADAESVIFLLALPNLESLTLDMKRIDTDAVYGEFPDDCEHVFRHEILRTLIQDPKAFGATGTTTSARYPLQNLEDFEMTQPFLDPFTAKSTYPQVVFADLKKVKGIFMLPNLESLEMSQIGASKEDVFSDEEISALSKSTQLESIMLMKSSLSADELSAIFGFAKHLKKVHYHVADPIELFERHGQDNVVPEMTSPRLLLEGLNQHKATLEYLHINSINGHTYWNGGDDDFFRGDDESIESDYDPDNDEQAAEHERRQRIACEELKQEYIQPIDLHDFEALRKVFVHATDLLGSMNKQDPQDVVPLAGVLPPGLEVLTLRYSNFFSDWDPQLKYVYEKEVGEDSGMYGAPWDVNQWKPGEHAEWYDAYYGHMTELLQVKAEKFPKLKQVTMCLQKGWSKPGKEILDLAAEVGVNLILGDYVLEGDVLIG